MALDIPRLTKKRANFVADPVNQVMRFRFADARFSNEKAHPKLTLWAITIYPFFFAIFHRFGAVESRCPPAA